MEDTKKFLRARQLLMDLRCDYDQAYHTFRWPEFTHFNWAIDWFDIYAKNNARLALFVSHGDGSETKLTFQEMSDRSSRIASGLLQKGLNRGDKILVMMPNIAPLWELMLAALKFGAVVVPTSMQASVIDLQDRVKRGDIQMVVTVPEALERWEQVSGTFDLYVVGDRQPGYQTYDDLRQGSRQFTAPWSTHPDDPFILYFTSGTTSLPKVVLHSQVSYPVGHLSTMYWIGIQEGDVHQNISSPGWAKHAWSSCFAPWNAGATAFVHDFQRFDPKTTLEVMDRVGIQSLCAPPTVWRMMIKDSLPPRPRQLRELVSAGEPLNPEVIQQVKAAWGLVVRDGYGQTETTAQIGQSPGQEVMPGSMGLPLPGYQIALLDSNGREHRTEGELAIRLHPRPMGLMRGYINAGTLYPAGNGDFYRTGDEATRSNDGTFHFLGRSDDLFKCSDYRISPFELESILVEHESVVEAAIVPSPDPLRLAVPKACVALKLGVLPNLESARDILVATNAKLSSYKRIRRIEFMELPKTISGKIRRSELKKRELINRASSNQQTRFEFTFDEMC